MDNANVDANGKKCRPFGWRDKVGYLLGDFGNDFSFMYIMAFLMVFYTDVLGIHPAQVGTLLLVARVFDAFTDILWGRFIDTRKPSKLGKFRPWILRMSVPLVISSALLFVYFPNQTNSFYLTYAYVTYILWGLFYTTVNIPYGSMASVISSEPLDRTSLSTWRTTGSMLANLIINVFGPLIVSVNNKLDPDRVLWTAIVFSALSLTFYIGCVRLTTERVVYAEKKNDGSNNLGKTLKEAV